MEPRVPSPQRYIAAVQLCFSDHIDTKREDVGEMEG